LGIGVGDRVLMLENTWYSVISPESCSSILWRSWDYKEKAAEALNLTADQMLKNKLIDGIIPEPFGGAHNNPEVMSKTLKSELKKHIKELTELKAPKLVSDRIKKFTKMGSYSDA
jgi:acetyl-CoA carboxylase carboxyl transferase subunit alpha